MPRYGQSQHLWVTQLAIVGLDPAEDGVTFWLHDGHNTLTVVLIGTPGYVPFRMRVDGDR
jgi:hypothetical protein